MEIFKLTLGLDTIREDPEFEWIEYFSTKEKMMEYVKKYKSEDWSFEVIELDKHGEILELK